MAGSRMDIGFQAFQERLVFGIMSGWPIQRSGGGDFRMRTHSRGFVRSPWCAAHAAVLFGKFHIMRHLAGRADSSRTGGRA